MIELRSGERAYHVARRHRSTLVTAFILPLVLLTAFIIGRWYFQFTFSGRSIQVFLITVVLSILWVWYKAYLWQRNFLVITNQRLVIIEQQGIFSRSAHDILYDDIVDVRFLQKGPGALVYRYGTLVMKIARQSTISIKKIPHPEKVVEYINQGRAAARPAAHVTSTHAEILSV